MGRYTYAHTVTCFLFTFHTSRAVRSIVLCNVWPPKIKWQSDSGGIELSAAAAAAKGGRERARFCRARGERESAKKDFFHDHMWA